MECKEEPMWPYWRDKCGYINALQDYYPKIAREDTLIAIALTQIKMAEYAIDKRMEELNV